MSGNIQLRAFMGLSDLFKERHWSNPRAFEVADAISGTELLQKLDIPPERVEVIFVNHKAYKPASITISPGDTVALAPPGVPGPYRVMLGFKNKT